MSSDNNLLEVHHLTISFPGAERPAVSNVNFTLSRGETIGIVGESGSGKSLTSLALMGLLPKGASVSSGEARFYSSEVSTDLLKLDEDSLRNIRGRRIAMIFQEPMTSLNPVMKCGEQVAEAVALHRGIKGKTLKECVIDLFREVELPRPETMYESYPHQLSGGQKQRVMIAMAMSCEPDLIIADEPTTALDVTVQKRVLELLNKLREKNNMGMVFISHDLGVISAVADKVMVMYRGEVLELGAVSDVLRHPNSNYTRALIECRPRLDKRPYRLTTVAQLTTEGTKPVTDYRVRKQPPQNDILLKAENLHVWYPSARDWKGKPSAWVQAVNDVSIDVRRGETLGLVGESGCGKSTLGRALLRLTPLHSGKVIFDGTDITEYPESMLRPLRKRMQLIFQDPYASLNPRLTIESTLEEPLRVHGIARKSADVSHRIDSILDKVGLAQAARNKYPHEFSGGQRQRICIARALMVEPEFIVCDESVSALDVSVQAQILNLLNDLKDEFGLTYIFISHDLSVVKYMSDRMVVMRRGVIEEMGATDNVYSNPQSEYTAELIRSIPELKD